MGNLSLVEEETKKQFTDFNSVVQVSNLISACSHFKEMETSH